MKKHIIAAGIGIVIVTALIFIFLMTKPQSQDITRNTIRVGSVLPLTGPAASLGNWIKNGYDLAVEDINQGGVVPDIQIELTCEDGMSDPKNSVSAFNKLSTINKIRILTTTLSPVSLAIIPPAKERGILIFAAAAHPGITGTYDLAFRHNLTVKAESDLLFSFMMDKIKPLRPRLIHLNDDYGVAFKNLWETSLSAVNLGLSSLSFDRSTQDMRSLAATALSDTPDSIVLVGYGQQLGTLLRRLRESNFSGSILVNNALPYPDVREAAGDAASGSYYVDYDIDSEDITYSQLSKRYRDRYNEDIPPIALFEHNTLLLIAKAYKATNGGNAETLADWIHSQNSLSLPGETVTITREGDIIPKLKINHLP